MGSVTSQLMEQVRSDLLDESATFEVSIMDSVNDRQIAKSAVELQNPYAVDWTRFVPNSMDYKRFLEVADELVQDAQVREGTVEGQRVSIVSDFPDENMHRQGNEVITYRLIERKPARMGAKGTSRPQRTANFEHSLRSESNPNKVITVEKRPIDHIVEFSCWALTSDLADRRALWLERLFVDHAWAFKIQGADRFYWENRGIDTYMTTGGGIKLYQRPLRFFVRLCEFRVIAEPVIQKINFQISHV